MKFKDLDGKIRDGELKKIVNGQYIIKTVEAGKKVTYGVYEKDLVIGDSKQKG